MPEPTLYARSSWTMIVITSPAYVDDGAPFTALYSRAPIDVVKLFVNGGQHAFLLRRRSELLLFDVAFTGSSECTTSPASTRITCTQAHVSVCGRKGERKQMVARGFA